MYDSIKSNELKFPDDVPPPTSVPNFSVESVVIKEGWLWKQGGLVRTWRRRWFVITDGCLFYFESVQVSDVSRLDRKEFDRRCLGHGQSSGHHSLARSRRARCRRRSDETILFRTLSVVRRENENEQTDSGRSRSNERRSDDRRPRISSIFLSRLSGSHTVFRMSAGSEEERKDWSRTLRIATQNQLPKAR